MKPFTRNDLDKSLTLFVLNDVEASSRESALELYLRWRKVSRINLRNPENAFYAMEYLAKTMDGLRTGNLRKESLRETARCQGLIAE